MNEPINFAPYGNIEDPASGSGLGIIMGRKFFHLERH
jgi:hypothetical protein